MDKNGDGFIGYNEFCELTEERWRGIDPFAGSKAEKSVDLNYKNLATLDDNLKSKFA